MGLNAKFSALALKFIVKYGKPATLTRTTTTHSSATLTVTPATVDYACSVVLADATDKFAAQMLARGGSRVAYVYSETLGVEPRVGDKLLLDATTWVVMEVQPIYAEASPVMFALSVKS